MIRRYIAMMALAVAGQVWAAGVSEVGRSAVEAARSYGAAVRSCDLAWAADSMYPPLKLTYAEMYSNRNGNEAENARRAMRLTHETKEQAYARAQAGLRALREHYAQMSRQMAAGGLKVESFVVKDPVAEYVVTTSWAPASGAGPTSWADESYVGGEIERGGAQGKRERSRIVVLPTVLVVSGPSRRGGVTRVERRSHIYAIRDEVVNGALDRNGMTCRNTKLNKWYFVDSNTDVNTLRAFFPNLPLRLALPDGGERELR